MKNIKDIYIGLLSLFNYPYISKSLLKDIKGPILLHISDTPVDIYNYIFRIVDILKPEYIIHTGDMVDNIKLENYKNRIESYHSGVEQLINGLEKNEFSEIYYVLGNHDDYKTISQLSKRGIILEEGLLTIDGCNLAISHYHSEYPYEVDFNLYGHSFEPMHYNNNGTVGLNGILNINIIDLSDKNVFHLKYPVGTNISRGMELKSIGI